MAIIAVAFLTGIIVGMAGMWSLALKDVRMMLIFWRRKTSMLKDELQVAQYERECDEIDCVCEELDPCPYHRSQMLIDGTDGRVKRSLFVGAPARRIH